MRINSDNLFKRDNTGKIRHVELYLDEFKDHNKDIFYSISGRTGLYLGKMVLRPLVTIDQGKVKRTIKEQAQLQYNSLINSYLDKGYKKSEDLNIIDITNSIEVESKVPKQNTDGKGNLKPMLALSIDNLPKSKLSILNNK